MVVKENPDRTKILYVKFEEIHAQILQILQNQHIQIQFNMGQMWI